MNKHFSSLINNIRITLAIAWKDILDGFKNKIVLTSVLTSLFLVAFYSYLPDLTNGDEQDRLVIWDQTNSPEMEDMADLSGFSVSVVSENAAFLETIRDMDVPTLGVVLEPDFLSQLPQNRPLTIQGYTPYWMKTEEISKITIDVESVLSSYFRRDVAIKPTISTVFPVMDSNANGKSFIAMAGLLIQVTVMGLSMAPQLIVEEKEAKTLQAVIVSPANLGHFIFGKTLAVFFYTMLTTAIGLIFLSPLIIHWGFAVSSLIIGMFAIITPGILLGVLLQSKQQISIWIWVMFFPTILPFFFSIVRILPEGVMRFVDWWPTVVLFRLINTGFTLNPPFHSYWKEGLYMILLSLILILFTIRVIRSKTLKGK
jgi:hypothetical protein